MKTQVLANWQPSMLDRSVVKSEFTKLISTVFYPKYWEYAALTLRSPDDYDRLKQESIITHGVEQLDFHPDGDVDLVIVWSNKFPTEVRLASGKMLHAKDGDVILINNRADQHRGPLFYTYHNERWFIRLWDFKIKGER
jgi:hypothetical protein